MDQEVAHRIRMIIQKNPGYRIRKVSVVLTCRLRQVLHRKTIVRIMHVTA